MSRRVVTAFAFAAFLLVGCDSEPTPTPDLVSTQVVIERAAAATLTAAAPTPTPTPTPTSTPSHTPTPTPTPSSTPTLPPTQTPTPTPTVVPNEKLETAARLQENGDYAESVLTYSDMLDDEGITADQSRQARYLLAESYLLEGEYIAAALAWEQFVDDYPDDSRLPQAMLMAARAYQAANQCDRAIAAYQAFQTHQSILNDLVYEWIGDCHAMERRLEDAIGAYRQALGSTDDQGVQVSLREKIADAYLTLDDYGAAITEYDTILESAQIEDYRAKIEYLAGQTLAAADQTDAAFARYQRAIENYPQAEYAYFALVELVYGGADVDEFQRGLIDYYAGAKYPDAYGASMRAFDRYLSSGPDEKVEEALYYKALAQSAIGQTQDAVATLAQIITEYPDSEMAIKAWYEMGGAQVQAGDTDGAIETYKELAAQYPDSQLAPEALWQGARTRQGEGTYAEAAGLYEALVRDFSDYENADAALWYAGLARYRADEVEKAVGNWQSLLDKYPDSIYGPKTRYWLGKVGAKPEDADAVGYWEQLLDEIPHTYYALRVQQLDAGESLTSTRLITTPVESRPWDGAQYQTEVLPWLRGWTEVPTGTESLSLPITVTQGSDLARGQLMLQVGLRTGALDVFERVRSSVESDPLALAELGRFFREQGIHGLAAASAARLADLWPDGDIHDAPLTLQHLAYPLAYADLLSAEAATQGLDPLLLAALVRQESLFEPAAESSVGARGLGQVMPGTGESIARELGVDDFEVNDLYRPSVSIQFGAYYLASQLERFDNQILVALAAYNAGPGNALQWLESSGDDLDLFVEVITAVQSRLYLQGVLEQYAIYEQLYRSLPESGESPEQ
jgi:soluble lytic murein transglycosylase